MSFPTSLSKSFTEEECLRFETRWENGYDLVAWEDRGRRLAFSVIQINSLGSSVAIRMVDPTPLIIPLVVL